MADNIPEADANKKPLYRSSFHSLDTNTQVNPQAIVGEAKDITSEIQAADPLNENESRMDIKDVEKERQDLSSSHDHDPDSNKKEDYTDKSSI